MQTRINSIISKALGTDKHVDIALAVKSIGQLQTTVAAYTIAIKRMERPDAVHMPVLYEKLQARRSLTRQILRLREQEASQAGFHLDARAHLA